MSHSARFQISATIFAALQAAVGTALPASTVVEDNPDEPSTLRDGMRVVFIQDEGDALLDKSAQDDKRRFTLTLGALCRTGETSRSDVDELFEAARNVAEAAVTPASMLTGVTIGRAFHLTDIALRLEGVDAGGAIILGTFEIEYRPPRRPLF